MKPKKIARLIRRFRLWLAIRLIPADVFVDLLESAECWWSERPRGDRAEFDRRMRLVRWADSRAKSGESI